MYTRVQMAPHNIPRPTAPAEPKPEQFGLTPEKLRSREEEAFWPNCLLMPFGFAVFVTLYLCTVTWIWGELTPGSFAAGFFLLWPFIGSLVGSFVLTLFIYILLGGVTHLFRTRPSDADAYDPYYEAKQSYSESLADYELKLENWRRTQLDWWHGLTGPGFETELGTLFRNRGYQV